jgi:hypothetical protein
MAKTDCSVDPTAPALDHQTSAGPKTTSLSARPMTFPSVIYSPESHEVGFWKISRRYLKGIQLETSYF